MTKQSINLNELHEQFLNAGFVDASEEELQKTNGGHFYVYGVDYGNYRNFYLKYGDYWNCLTGN
jgi:hypothetical protein